MALRFVLELLCLAIGLLGGRARSFRGLIGKPPRLREGLGCVFDKLLGVPLGCLGITLGFCDLLLDLLLSFLAQLFGVRLGIFAFAPYEFLGGLLSLRNSLFDLSTRFEVDLLEAGATTFAHLAGAVCERLGFSRGGHSPLLGLPSAFCCVVCAPRPDLDRVPDGRGIDYGCCHLPALLARASRSASDRIRGFRDAGQKPGSVRWHLP